MIIVLTTTLACHIRTNHVASTLTQVSSLRDVVHLVNTRIVETRTGRPTPPLTSLTTYIPTYILTYLAHYFRPHYPPPYLHN